MRHLLLGLSAIIFITGCGKAPENAENSDSAAKVDPKDPAVREPFMYEWNKKELDPGFKSQNVSFRKSGVFSLHGERVGEAKPGFQKYTVMSGRWQNLTAKKIEFTNKNPSGAGEQLTAVLLDPETLEIELNGVKSLYVRGKNLKDYDPKTVKPDPEAEAREKAEKFQYSWTIRNDQDLLMSSLTSINDRAHSANFTFVPPQGQSTTIKATWKVISDTRIEYYRVKDAGAAPELYATGELLDDKTLRVTIAGEVFDFKKY